MYVNLRGYKLITVLVSSSLCSFHRDSYVLSRFETQEANLFNSWKSHSALIARIFSELEADIDDIYQTYKKSTLAENSNASKLREFVSQFKTHKEKMGYTKTDIMRIFKDD